MIHLVTGASGHIGSNLVKLLIEKGETVRAMVRKSSSTVSLPTHKNLQVVYGDVYDSASLLQALGGVSLLYHTAAVYSLSRKNPGEILNTAVQGTRNILEAVKKSGAVRRVVYTSSVAAVGMTEDPRAQLNESNWTSDREMDEYTQAKLESEKLAHSLANQLEIDLVVVNPSLVLGPLDRKPTPSNKVVVDFLNGKVPAYLETGLSAVHVEDVARGHMLAMEKGRSSERYILSGDNVKLKDFFQALANISGRKPPGIKLPRPLAIGMAALFELGSAITKTEPVATVQGMRSMTNRYSFFSNEKARRELGYQPRGLKETLESTVQWFQENPIG